MVLVADTTAALGDLGNLQEIVFANEKIGLGMKAFRAVRISPENADRDPILADHGRTVPRLLLVDPSRSAVKVLEEGKIKVSTLFGEMKRIAGNCYKERLDKLVKDHLKLLTEQDQLANEEKVLREKEQRLGGEQGARAEKDLGAVRAELEEVARELAELGQRQEALWKLTAKPRSGA